MTGRGGVGQRSATATSRSRTSTLLGCPSVTYLLNYQDYMVPACHKWPIYQVVHMGHMRQVCMG